MRKNDIIEKLAAYEHDRWSRWQKYLFSKCINNQDGGLTIPKEFVDRWTIFYPMLQTCEKKKISFHYT